MDFKEKSIRWKDFNFKLAVIEQLMYRENRLPAFDVRTFVGEERWTKIDREKHSSRAIRDVSNYFRNLEIPEQLLAEVEILDQNYHTVYQQVTPFWDGEGDEFNIRSTDDLKLVPNLKEVILLYDREQKMADAFAGKGIKARYL